MRSSLVLTTLFGGIFAGILAAEAAAPSAVAAALKADVVASATTEPICTGCGCRGGPGYRGSNGKCASWGRRR